MNSMERRLQLGLTLLLIVLMGLFWYVINHSIHVLVEDFIVSRLEHDAINMISALKPDPKRTRVRWRRINDIYNKVNSGHYYVFKFADGRVLNSPSLWDKSLDVPPVPPEGAIRYQTSAPANQRVLVWAKNFTKSGQSFTLAVAEDLGRVRAQRQIFKQRFALLALGGFLSLLILQSWLVRRSFRKLDKVQQDIVLLECGSCEKLSEDVPDEIKPLVGGFNRLLKLLTARLVRSRNSLGNLAHALKGPLNLLMMNLNSSDEFDRDDARRHGQRLTLLIERELKRARIAGLGTSAKRFNASKELPDLIGVLNQSYGNRGLEIICRGADLMPVFGDREDMLELIGNVLDNACKWARASVICDFKIDDAYHITIKDDGQGLGDAQLDMLAQRGVRLDESVEGSGLGLAIARDIISLYGGVLRFDRSKELGGLRAEIRLPIKTA